MSIIRSWRWLVVVAALVLVQAVPAQDPKPATPEVKLEKVKYEKLGEIVRNLKGKVVVVDFWATTCPPCMAEFPHLVELHNKYTKDGLAAVSVSLDDLSEDGEVAEKAALRFLQSKRATFTNLLLDEKPEAWQQKLGSPTMPIVFVFNRAGKVVKKYTDNVSYAEIERLVVELLKEK